MSNHGAKSSTIHCSRWLGDYIRSSYPRLSPSANPLEEGVMALYIGYEKPQAVYEEEKFIVQHHIVSIIPMPESTPTPCPRRDPYYQHQSGSTRCRSHIYKIGLLHHCRSFLPLHIQGMLPLVYRTLAHLTSTMLSRLQGNPRLFRTVLGKSYMLISILEDRTK